MSKSYLWNLEKPEGTPEPSATTLYEIAKALGTTMWQLLNRKLLAKEVEATERDPVLAKFIKADKISDAEAATLASIQWRGEPQDRRPLALRAPGAEDEQIARRVVVEGDSRVVQTRCDRNQSAREGCQSKRQN